MTEHNHNVLSLCRHLGLEHDSGMVDTGLSGVRLLKLDKYSSATPHMYQQSIAVILQGTKIGNVNEHELIYDKDQCLIVATPYPIGCETFASEGEPLIGLYIDLDITMISELVEQMSSQGMQWPEPPAGSIGVATTKLNTAMHNCLDRLVSALQDPHDTQVLGPQLMREFYYRLLQGEDGYLLHLTCRQDSPISRVSTVINHIQQHYDEKLPVSELATMAGMSVSVFHRMFKQVVTDPPLQYIKKVRLNKAKTHILSEGLSAQAAAFKVGYESPTQFSREFKRYFGLSPSQMATDSMAAF